MSLDQMTDDELDAQIRRLLPGHAGGRDWELGQRERLLHFIATGETSSGESGVADAPVEVRLIRSGPHTVRSRRARRVAMAAAAVAMVVVVGIAVAVVGNSAGGPSPAVPVAPSASEAPSTSEASMPASEASVPATVPSLPMEAVRPDRFPVVADGWPTAATASAMWGGMVGWDNPTSADALVARRDGDYLRDAVALTVRSEATSSPAAPTHRATVAGTDVEVSFETGSPTVTSAAIPGTPTIIASGLDPLTFIEAAGGMPVVGARIDDAGEITFAISDLPDGYEVVVPPSRLPLGSVDAVTRASDGDGGDGISVGVGVHSPLTALAQVGDLAAVDINGTAGWLHDRDPGATVVWQVSETTWAVVGGAANADDALRFARSVDFVDEATWAQRYRVEEPDYPTSDQMLAASATTAPVATTLAATSVVTSRSGSHPAAGEAPVACGDDPPVDEPIDNAPTASSPDAALAAFLTDRARMLYRDGYEQLGLAGSGSYRYERRNESGDLVIVIDVTAAGDLWQATRLQTSPC